MIKSAPFVLGQVKVWVMPAYAAGNGSFFPWNLASITEEARLIPERVSNRSNGMGTASFRWLRAWREDGAGLFYDGGYAVTGVYVAVTISGSSFVLSNVIFWGFISRNDIAEIAGGNDKTGTVTALGLGYILDGTQCSGWRQGASGGASTAMLNCPPFNMQGDGGAIIGNKVSDISGIPVVASLPSACTTSNLFSRLDILQHFFTYCAPAAIPTLGLTGAAAIGTYLAGAASQQVFELENITLKGVIDLCLNRSSGISWQVVPNISGGWDINTYSLNDNAAAYDPTFPSAIPTDIDFSGNTSVDVSYSEDASELPDSVTVQGARVIFGVSVAISDGNLQKGWTTAQQTAYLAGASAAPGYSSLPPSDCAERNEQVRKSVGIADVFSLFTIPTTSTTPLRSTAPGNSSASVPLVPAISWDGTTAAVDDNTSRVPYLPEMRLERMVPWLVGVKGDGTDNRTAEAKAQPSLMETTVWHNQVSPPANDTAWKNLGIPWKNRHGATVTLDDRGPGIRVHFQPQEILAKGNFTDGTDAITKLDINGVIGTPINLDTLKRPLNYIELVATIAVASDQRVSVTKARYGVPPNAARRNVVITDARLQCWVALAGTVVGVDILGNPDRVAAHTFIRNDFAQAERLCAMYAAWLFRKRSSLSITFAFSQLFPAWLYIGNMIGRVTESAATGSYPSIVTDSYTVIESIDYTFGDHPRAVISTTIPPMPEHMQSGSGSGSPSGGGPVSAALGGTVAQAAARSQGKIADLKRDTAKIATSIGRPGIASVGGDSISTKSIAQVAHGFTLGNIVYLNGSTWTKAKADAVATSGYVGVVSNATLPDVFDLTYAGMVTGLSALTPGTVYYLSDATAGAAIIKGSLGADALPVPVFVAISTTQAYLFATSDIAADINRQVLGDKTTGGATFKHWFAANKYLELQADGTLTLFQSATAKVVINASLTITITYTNGNTVTFAASDFVGSSKDVRLREVDICDNTGTAKKILVLASAPY